MFNLMRRGCTLVQSLTRQQQQQQLLQLIPQRLKASRPWYETPRTPKPMSICIPQEMPKYLLGFNGIPELENANENVQKIFSLEMGSNRDFRRAVSSVNRTLYATDIERQVADKTHQIRILTEQLSDKAGRNDKQSKQYFIALIHRRKRLLRKLQQEDAAAYHALIEKMDIPPLQEHWDNHQRYKSRRFKINVPMKKKRDVRDFEHEFVC